MPTPPPGTRLVLVSEDALELFGTRTEDGDRLSFEWGEPDENGWYSPIVTRTQIVPPDEEVRFQTSAGRIEDAFARMYPNDPGLVRDMFHHFIRRLAIPTENEEW